MTSGIVEVTRATETAIQKAKIWLLLEGEEYDWIADMPSNALQDMIDSGMPTKEPDVNIFIDARERHQDPQKLLSLVNLTIR